MTARQQYAILTHPTSMSRSWNLTVTNSPGFKVYLLWNLQL